MKHRKRARYTGNVPKPLLRPIRAGILQAIDTDALIILIATLEPIVSDSAGAADPAASAAAAARAHVVSIVADNYTRVQLLDSVFWGDDTTTRKDGRRYVHPPRPAKRARAAAPTVAAPLIAYNFRSPSWGPIWPAPDKYDQVLDVAYLLHPETYPYPGFEHSTSLTAIMAGDVIETWPAVSRFLLALPSPLRPWRIDPAHRQWYAHTLCKFLAHCLVVAPDRGTPDGPLLRQLLDTLHASADDALEEVIAALESAHTSERPPRQPGDDAATVMWPVALLESARRRAAICLSSEEDYTAKTIVRDNIVRWWPEVACAWLGIPCPIGTWRLRRSHLQHCYSVLDILARYGVANGHQTMKFIKEYLDKITEHDDGDIQRLLFLLQTKHDALL